MAQSLIPHGEPADYNQAIMDFGAIQCTPASPRCATCPLCETCIAFREHRTEGLPVKSKKVKQRERRFTYLYIEHQGHIAIHQRGPETSGRDCGNCRRTRTSRRPMPPDGRGGTAAAQRGKARADPSGHPCRPLSVGAAHTPHAAGRLHLGDTRRTAGPCPAPADRNPACRHTGRLTPKTATCRHAAAVSGKLPPCKSRRPGNVSKRLMTCSDRKRTGFDFRHRGRRRCYFFPKSPSMRSRWATRNGKTQTAITMTKNHR